jgi:hypothetical protein
MSAETGGYPGVPNEGSDKGVTPVQNGGSLDVGKNWMGGGTSYDSPDMAEIAAASANREAASAVPGLHVVQEIGRVLDDVTEGTANSQFAKVMDDITQGTAHTQFAQRMDAITGQ